ncbi:MAG: hypothetical protein M3Q29_05475 [Chloroflexota bacterium]|nr:hypothetical protein [Chloroflexota bacterium]
MPEQDPDFDARIARVTERIEVARRNGEVSQERALLYLRSLIAHAGGRPDPEPEAVPPAVIPERTRTAAVLQSQALRAIEQWAADALDALAQSAGDSDRNARDRRMVNDLAREAIERLGVKTDPEWWLARSKNGEDAKRWMREVFGREDLIRLGVRLGRK